LDKSKVELVAWMKEVRPINSGDKHFHEMARIADQPDRLLVVDHESGAAWEYCITHNFVFAVNAGCALCMDIAVSDDLPAADMPNEAGVTARNTPEIGG
jgi:hypothetical protein